MLAAPQNPLKKDETEEVSVSPAAAKEISTDVATATVLSATAGIFRIKEARRTTPSGYSMEEKKKAGEGVYMFLTSVGKILAGRARHGVVMRSYCHHLTNKSENWAKLAVNNLI